MAGYPDHLEAAKATFFPGLLDLAPNDAIAIVISGVHVSKTLHNPNIITDERRITYSGEQGVQQCSGFCSGC